MKITTEGTFNAKITGQAWEETKSGQPLCKIQFSTDQGDIQGAFYFDSDPPKFGTETALEKNSRNFAGAIPGWTADNMDRDQTYVGASVTITTKYNQKGYLNVNGIFPLGHQGGGKKLDTAGSSMERLRAAAKIAAAGIVPPPAPPEDTDNVPY